MRLFRNLGDALKAGFVVYDLVKNGYVVRKPDPSEMGIVDTRNRRELPELEDSIHLNFLPRADGEDQC
jgi:hypothetical protein